MASVQSTVEQVWQTYDAMEVRLTAPLTARMLDLAQLVPGMRVLDLATGRGEPAIPFAHRVGPSGAVVGVDTSIAMLEMAKARAEREGLSQIEFHVADAAALQDLALRSSQVATCRWGLMYMAAPGKALTAAFQALAPGGRLVTAVWAEPGRVPYFSLPRQVLEKYRPVPAVDFEVPGTFRYALADRLENDVRKAGFEVEHVEEMDLAVMEAKTCADLVAWVRAFGMEALVKGLPDSVQRAWEADLCREAERFRQADGFVRLGGVTRLLVGRRPE